MAKLPEVPQVSTALTPTPGRANTGAVEAAVSKLGADVTNVANQFSEAHQILQRRDGAVRAAQVREQFSQRARELFLKEQDEGTNFRDPAALPKYYRQLRETQAKMLQDFKGPEDIRARLSESLIGLTGRFHANGMQQMRTEQRAAISRQVNDATATFAEEAADDPARIPEIVKAFADEVGNYADATTPDEFQGLVENGTATIIGAALDRQIAFGNAASARQIFEQAKPLLIGPDRRKFDNQILALEGQAAKDNAKIAARRARIATTLGGEDKITPTIALAIEGITLPKRGPLTLSETIAEYEAVMTKATGKPYRASPREIQVMRGTHKKLPDTAAGGDLPFGKGAPGRAHAMIADLSDEFANKLLTPDEEKLYLAAVSIALQPNQATGQPGSIPPFAMQALRMRGYDPRQFAGFPAIPGATVPGGELLQSSPSPAAAGAGDGVPAVTPPPLPGARSETAPEPGFAQPGSEADKPTLAPETAVQESRQYEAQGGLLAPQANLPQRTVFEMAELVTGPVSTIQSKGARIPLIGGFIESSPVTQARAYLPILVKDLVRVLQNNPKFADAERQAITRDVELEGSFFDRPERFRDNLIGLDDALEVRQQNALSTLVEGAVGKDEYTHTLNVLNALKKFRDALGVPPVMSSPEEVAKKLKPGDKYRRRGPDGGWLVKERK